MEPGRPLKNEISIVSVIVVQQIFGLLNKFVSVVIGVKIQFFLDVVLFDLTLHLQLIAGHLILILEIGLVRFPGGAAFFTDLAAAFLTVFFFEVGLDALTAARFFTVFLTAFFFGDGVAFFVRDDFFVTAFFFLFAIPIPPLRFSAA